MTTIPVFHKCRTNHLTYWPFSWIEKVVITTFQWVVQGQSMQWNPGFQQHCPSSLLNQKTADLQSNVVVLVSQMIHGQTFSCGAHDVDSTNHGGQRWSIWRCLNFQSSRSEHSQHRHNLPKQTQQKLHREWWEAPWPHPPPQTKFRF